MDDDPDFMLLIDLGPEHLDPLKTAFYNLFKLEVTQDTFAQILNGVPTLEAYAEDHWFPIEELPFMEEQHSYPCDHMQESVLNLVFGDLYLTDIVFRRKVSTISWLQWERLQKPTVSGCIRLPSVHVSADIRSRL